MFLLSFTFLLLSMRPFPLNRPFRNSSFHLFLKVPEQGGFLLNGRNSNRGLRTVKINVYMLRFGPPSHRMLLSDLSLSWGQRLGLHRCVTENLLYLQAALTGRSSSPCLMKRPRSASFRSTQAGWRWLTMLPWTTWSWLKTTSPVPTSRWERGLDHTS